MSGVQSHILNESIGESREIKEYNTLPEIFPRPEPVSNNNVVCG